jgi:hypothetical protein
LAVRGLSRLRSMISVVKNFAIGLAFRLFEVFFHPYDRVFPDFMKRKIRRTVIKIRNRSEFLCRFFTGL